MIITWKQQYYRDKPALNVTGSIIDFHNNNNSTSIKIKQKITGQTGNDETKDVEISKQFLEKSRNAIN